MAKELNVWDVIRGTNVPTEEEINCMMEFAVHNADSISDKLLKDGNSSTALDPLEGNIHLVIGRIIGARPDAKELNKSLRLKFKDLIQDFKIKLSSIDLLTCTEEELLELGIQFGKIQAISNLTNEDIVKIITNPETKKVVTEEVMSKKFNSECRVRKSEESTLNYYDIRLMVDYPKSNQTSLAGTDQFIDLDKLIRLLATERGSSHMKSIIRKYLELDPSEEIESARVEYTVVENNQIGSISVDLL